MKNLFSFGKSNTKKSKNSKKSGFLESISEIGQSVGNSIKEDVVKGTAKDIHDQIITTRASQEPSKEQDFDFSEWMQLKEEKAEERGKEEGRKEERAFQKAKQKENVIFSLTDEKLKKEIQAVRQEIQLIAQSMQNLNQEIEKAIVEEVVDPGVYHLNFFEKLKKSLELLRKNLEDTELWMQMWKSRKQKSAYWQGFSKSGTKYSMSHERRLATQTG